MIDDKIAAVFVNVCFASMTKPVDSHFKFVKDEMI